MKESIGRIFSFLSTSSLWIAFVAIFRPALLYEASGLPVVWGFLAAAALLTFASHASDKVSGSDEDLVNTPERAWLANYPIGALSWVAGGLALLIVAAIDYTKLPFPALYLIVAYMYARRIGGARIKDIPAAKTLVVAGTTTFCFAGLVGGPWWLYALEFLLIGIDTVFFDLRDLKGDALAGVRSIPVLLGRGKTIALLIVADILLAMLYMPAAIYGAFLLWYFRKERDGLCYDVLVDGWSMWVLFGLYLSHLLI